MADKVEWMNKIRSVIQSKGPPAKGTNASEGGPSVRQSLSDGSLVSSSLTLVVSVRNFMLLFFIRCLKGL